MLVGINGAQGTGKSTLALCLKRLLAERHGLRSVILSIDDLYLGRQQRAQLAGAVHPLLLTRGVPGTHDLELAAHLLQRLKEPAREWAPVAIPRFIKAIDDRAPESQWTMVEAPVEVILFEGWCVGTPPQDEAELRKPMNELEAREDADGIWRRYVNRQLATVYASLFAQIDTTIFLQAPDFDSIFRWRLRQEGQNADALGSAPALAAGARNRIMGPEELRRFIQHYERLTRHALKLMPERADAVIELGADHEVLEMRFR